MNKEKPDAMLYLGKNDICNAGN
jgi:hypothetical protein